MNEKDFSPFEQELLKRFDSFEQRLDSVEDSMIDFQRNVNKRFDKLEEDIREIKSDIRRIDANIEIMATSQGYPYSKEQRIVSAFERKVS